VFSTVRNNFSRTVAINVVLDLLQPFVLLIDEISSTEVDQINNLLGSDESVSV